MKVVAAPYDEEYCKSMMEETEMNICKKWNTVINGLMSHRRMIVQSFSNSLSKYILLTKNKVGLALIIGDNVQEDADSFARRLENNKINYIVLIEKYYNTVRV
jgi:hypothetical protein